MDDLAGEKNDVAVQREPADCKDDHYQHQHLNGHYLLPLKGKVLLYGDVPNDSAEPQFFGHSHVGDGDDEKGQDVEQSECGQVQVLPEQICWLREIGKTQAPSNFFTGNQGQKQFI